MKQLAILVCILMHLSSFAQPPRQLFVDPTGTYILNGNKQKGKIHGQFAEVRVKLLNDTSIAITMYANKGYPDFISGNFMDTIRYIDNRALYTSKYDPDCQVVFLFDVDRVYIKQFYTDPTSTCGFTKGVLPFGYISKRSSITPLIQEISRPDSGR